MPSAAAASASRSRGRRRRRRGRRKQRRGRHRRRRREARGDGRRAPSGTSRRWSATSRATSPPTPCSRSSARSAACPAARAWCCSRKGIAIPHGGGAAVLGRHRRRQPRQRQHLHDGRRRPARRERAAGRPRHGRSARARRAKAATPPTAAAGRSRRSLEMNEDALRSDPATALSSWRRKPAAVLQQHQQPASRRSSGSTATSATTTCSATRRSTTPTTGSSARSRSRSSGPGVTVAARKGYFAVRNPADAADQRLGSAGARRPRAEAGAERVPGARRRAAVPRTRPARPRAGGRRGQDRAADLPAGQGRQELHVGLHRAGPLPRPRQPGRAQGEPALRDPRRARADRPREAGRGGVLPRVRAARRRLLDGDRRPRRAVGQVERALRDGRSAAARGEQAADEQPGRRQARREGAGKGSPPRQSRCWSTASRCPRTSATPISKAAKEAAVLLRHLSGARTAAARTSIDRAAAERQAGRRSCRCRCRRPMPPDASSRSAACRSTSSRPAPTSCAPSSSRATSRSLRSTLLRIAD